MMREGIFHLCTDNMCYCLNKDELKISIHTNKTIKKVSIIAEDPFINGCTPNKPWKGKEYALEKEFELESKDIWSTVVKPPFKRLQYYFIISDGTDTLCLFEDGFHDLCEVKDTSGTASYFIFGFMNESDIVTVPQWPKDTVWYQIFPDRFCRVGENNSRFCDWNDTDNITYASKYGGNLKGIISKLPYLKALNINGIYLNPVFKSNTNHRYDTEDYLTVDGVLGTNDDLKELVEKAHALNIRVMLDAVFNHTGTRFFAWKDIIKKGKASEYYDWYYIFSDDLNDRTLTKDGRYYTFGFYPNLPRLNTNNPKVQDYLIDACKNWIKNYDIDALRFDVGNEISHSFIAKLRRELKAVKEDIYLLTEIWTDCRSYLQGDQYDSVMNYPLLKQISSFFTDEKITSLDFVKKVNYCYSLYQDQINKVLFNLLDSHDMDRMRTRLKTFDGFAGGLTLLMTLPGTPCIYYGTEIAMEGSFEPYNRLPMPWDRIEKKEGSETADMVRKLISLRHSLKLGQYRRIIFSSTNSRVLNYTVVTENNAVEVMINAGTGKAESKTQDHLAFAYKADENHVDSGGIRISVRAL
ncbi:MAG: alpha amylase N-terminal ig-like domain-containing protein [Succinivibrio sp.]